MAGDFSVYGLSSGIDWSQVVDSIIRVEHRRVDVLNSQKSEYESKLSAWQTINSKLLSLKEVAEELSSNSGFSVFNVSFSSPSVDPDSILSASAGEDASPGTHTVRVISLAQRKSIQSKGFESSSSSLGISGDIIINGKVVHIDSDDSLSAIAGAINSADAGASASIVKVGDSDYRLVISSDDLGSEGFRISNGSSTNVLEELGLSTGTEALSRTFSGGVESDRFSSDSTAIGTLLGLSQPPSGSIAVAGVTVSIDLSTDSLQDIASKINTAWQNAGNSGNIASVEQDDSEYYLKILSTNLVDDANILDALGVMLYTQGSVAQVQESPIANTSGGSPITSDTLIVDIDTSTGGPKVGETITISGTDSSGSAVQATFTIQSDSTVGDLISAVETAFGGEVVGSVTSDGKLRFEAATPGETQLRVNLIANNEQGGGLDFGDLEVVTEGRDMVVSQGADAVVEVDGSIITKSSNQISDIIPGVTLYLKSADPDHQIELTVGRDVDQVVSKIEDFVNKINDVIGYINSQYSYKEGDESAPPLMGDGTLFMLLSDLRDRIYSPVEGLDPGKNALYTVGIRMNNDGTLEVDEDTLRQALAEDFDGTVELFTGNDSVDGVAKRLDEFLDYITNPYSNGYVETHMDEIQDDIDWIDERVDEFERMLDQERERLLQQFNALETYMAQMKSLQSWLGAQLGNTTG